MPAALQFVAAQPYLSGIVLGPRDASDVPINAQFLKMSIPGAYWDEVSRTEIDGQPLIHPSAPLPKDYCLA